MEIKEFQDEILRTFSEMDKMPNRREHTKQSAMIHLVEEIGEVARHVTNEYHRPEKFNKEKIGSELVDILMFVTVLAKLYNIDLSVEMKASIKRVENKIKELK